MIGTGFAFCRHCGRRRPVEDLVLVLPADRAPFAVCRPSVAMETECFRYATGPADRHPIRLLTEYLDEHRPSHRDAAGGTDAVA